MEIYAINNINFTARNNFTKATKIDTDALKRIRNNADNPIRKDIYKDIDSYVNKKSNKIEYLQRLNTLAHRINKKTKLNNAEKQYLDDMLTTMDLSGKNEKIPDKYILENISDLIKNQQ